MWDLTQICGEVTGAGQLGRPCAAVAEVAKFVHIERIWRVSREKEIDTEAAAHPKVVLDGGDDHARVDGEPAGDRRVDQQQDDRLEYLDDGLLRAAVEVVDHHAQPQRPLAAKLRVMVLHGAQQVVQVLDLRLDPAHETEGLRHVGAPRRLLRLLEEHVTPGAA